MTSPIRGTGQPAPRDVRHPFAPSGDDLSEEARALLKKARRPAPPTAAEKAMMLAMAARIAAVPVAPTGGRAVWSKLAKLGTWKGIGVAGVVLALGGTTWLGVSNFGDSGEVLSTSATELDLPASTPPGDGVAAAHPSTDPKTDLAAPTAPALPSPEALPPKSVAITEPQVSAPAPRPAASTAPRPAASTTAPRPAASTAQRPAASTTAPRSVASTAQGASTSSGASPEEPVAAAAPEPTKAASLCPVGPFERGDRSAETALLGAAARALSTSPAVTLACVGQLSRIGGPFQLADEHAFLSFEASRRLGREADAIRYAEALLKRSPHSAYSTRVRAYLDKASPR